MDAQTCLKKMNYVGVLAIATADENGAPQVRNISAVHYEADSFYFFTARGKDFARQLLFDGRVQVLAYTKYKEMTRLSGTAVPAAQEKQREYIDTIFREQPYLENLHPGDTRSIGIIFEVKDADIEYFNLGVNPIFREQYTIGRGTLKPKGFAVTGDCIACGKCAAVCPSGASPSPKKRKSGRNTAFTAATARNTARPARYRNGNQAQGAAFPFHKERRFQNHFSLP